jgi:serine/threonine-protein kinase
VTNDTGTSGGRANSETGRFTVRRVRSALSLWRTSIRGTDILVASFFVALSLGLGVYVFARARAATHLAFTQKAQHLQANVNEKLSTALENLYTIRSFVEASDQVTRSQFRLLAYPMLVRNIGVYAFEWLPLVHPSERAYYEAEARASSLTGYRIWEVGEGGKPREVGRRALYVPIHYMEPPNSVALGFDIASDPIRWKTASLGRDYAKIAASPPFILVQDEGKRVAPTAVAAYLPAYREGDPGSVEARINSVRGFAVAIFLVAPLVNKAASFVDASGVGLSLKDPAEPQAPTLAERPTKPGPLARRAGFEIQFPVTFADRTWSLEVFALPGAFLPPKRASIEVALAGVLVSLIGLVTLTSLRTITRLRRQAEKVGPYQLVARLGAGAMGVVWEARHALLRRPTAVKLLAPGTGGEKALARFEREVQLTAGLTHPSTIAIYDYGRTAEGIFYYAMELLRGINLQQLVSFDGPLPPGRVVSLLRQACGALTEAHAAGLIHRDIKPANLMVCIYGGIPDFLKVLDFGLVKDIGTIESVPEGEEGGQGDAALSQDGSVLGTPLYMAPEGMSDPTNVDVRADLFALGAVGYFLLTGVSPFPGHTAIEVFTMERKGPAPPLSGAAPNPVPACLEEVIRRCLAFNREERPASAEALDAMLEACAVSPLWKLEDARAWWQDRGKAALLASRAQRVERREILNLSSDSSDRAWPPVRPA